MNLIVDTSVWSLVLRRRSVDENNPYVSAFRGYVERGYCIHLLGSILQELLDGVRTQKDFDHLEALLRPFPLIEIKRDVYALASHLRNHCRKKGVQAGPVDFLIAAVSIQNAYPLLTADRDFLHIAKHCDLMLLAPQV